MKTDKKALKPPGKVEARDFRAELAKPKEKSLLNLTIFVLLLVGQTETSGLGGEEGEGGLWGEKIEEKGKKGEIIRKDGFSHWGRWILGGDFGGCCPFLASLGTILSPPRGRRRAAYKGGPRTGSARPSSSPETAQIRPKIARFWAQSSSSFSILYKKLL